MAERYSFRSTSPPKTVTLPKAFIDICWQLKCGNGVTMPAAHCVSSLEGIILQADQGLLDLLQRREDDVIGVSYRQITDPRDLQRSIDMLAVLEEGAAPVRLHRTISETLQ